MTLDIHTYTLWIRVVTVFAAACVTSVPIVYGFSPWWSRWFGRLFMAHAVALAIALDRAVLFIFWRPQNLLLQFVINGSLLLLVAGACIAMSVLIWLMNHPSDKKGRHRKR